MLELTTDSTGDPAKHARLDDLCAGLAALAPAPLEIGRISLIIRKTQRNLREMPERLRLTPQDGIPGDAWGRASNPDRDAQLAVMQTDVATLVANGQPLGLFGDNLFLDLDVRADNLPVGSWLRLGRARAEVTPKPHDGCSKFRARFGSDALLFVSDPARRPRNLRGIYLRIIEAGEAAVGDPVQVIWRP